MDSVLIVVALVFSIISAIGVVGIFLVIRSRNAGATGDDLEAKLLGLSTRLEGKFTDASKERNDGLLHQSERVGKLERELATRMATLLESQKQSLTIADEVRNLTRILKTPSARGQLGEFFLEAALKNVLAPGLYEMQYTFPGRDLRADAIIKYEGKIIAIDAKFSLDNYNRYVEAATDAERDSFAKAIREDFKKRIDETAKYVRPEDDTFDFAMMFVPSEALYYDLIVSQVGSLGRERSLIDYAHEKKVVIVSPMVLYAYLQTVLQGIRQMRFAKDAEEIRKRVGDLAAHLRVYEDLQRKLGQSITASASTFNKAATEFNKIDKDVVKITGETLPEIEAVPGENEIPE